MGKGETNLVTGIYETAPRKGRAPRARLSPLAEPERAIPLLGPAASQLRDPAQASSPFRASVFASGKWEGDALPRRPCGEESAFRALMEWRWPSLPRPSFLRKMT